MLAKLIPNDRGIVNIHQQTTYGGLNGIVPRDQCGQLNFAKVMDRPGAASNLANYERTVMLLTGGFAD